MKMFTDRPVPSEHKTLDSYAKTRDRWLAKNPGVESAEEFLASRDGNVEPPVSILKRSFKKKSCE